MGGAQRKGLVVSARWLALGGDQTYVNDAADQLASALFDPVLGACEPAAYGVRVLHDPTYAELDDHLVESFRSAAQSGSALVICLVGHGHVAVTKGPFFFLPADHPASLNDVERFGYPLAERILSLSAAHKTTDGLILLVDACRSGKLIQPDLRDWALPLPRLAMATSTGSGAAWEARFTRIVSEAIVSGIRGAGDYIKVGDFRPLMNDLAEDPGTAQFPHHFSHSDSDDSGLWVSPNRAQRADFVAGLVARVTRFYGITDRYQRPEVPDLVADAIATHRTVAVLGPSGSGKSATLQMIAIDSLDPQRVREIRAEDTPGQAVAFFPVAADTTPAYFAEQILGQLDQCTFGAFRSAADTFLSTVPEEDWERLSPIERWVTGPLRHLGADTDVLLVIDGLDQLPAIGGPDIAGCLVELADDTEYEHVKVVVSIRHRPEQPPPKLPDGFTAVPMPRPSSNQVRNYLRRRGVDRSRLSEIESVAEGNWLIITLLCNGLADRPDGGLPTTRAALYNQLLDNACARRRSVWESSLAPVMAVLNCAGAGVALPLDVLRHASGELGGPDSTPAVRDSIVALHRVVERLDAGTSLEHVMLIHPTLVEHLSSPENEFAVPDLARAHAAVAAVLARLAPMTQPPGAGDDPTRAYANRSEAMHRWEAGDFEGAISVLIQRSSSNARENRDRWVLWTERITQRLGARHPLSFQARQQLAFWTSRCGLYTDALELYDALVPDISSAAGQDDPLVLRVLFDEAMCRGVNGAPSRARDRLRELEPRVAGAMGPFDALTLEVRHALGSWTGLAGDPHSAVAELRGVLQDCLVNLGPGHPETLACRNSLARWTGESGEPAKAVDEFRALLPTQASLLGPLHRETLRTRYSIAYWSGEAGQPAETLRLFRELIEVQEQALGEEHPDTLRTLHGIGLWTGVNGDPADAVRILSDLLPVRERVLGLDHPDTLRTLNNLGRWTGALGRYDEAITILNDTLGRRTRTLGAEHPDTMRTMNNIIDWTGAAGDHVRALELSEALLPLQQRVLGPSHQDTLRTRFNSARWLAASGQRAPALDALRALHGDQVNALGADHPDAVRTQREIEVIANGGQN